MLYYFLESDFAVSRVVKICLYGKRVFIEYCFLILTSTLPIKLVKLNIYLSATTIDVNEFILKLP